MRHSLISHCIYFFIPTSARILWRIRARARVCTRKCDCVETVYKLSLLPNTSATETFLHKSGAVRSVWVDIIIEVRAWLRLVEYVTMDKTWYNLLFEQEVVAAPSYFHIFFLITFLEDAFNRSLIILCINYIVICMNNNAVIDNNLWKTRRPYFGLQSSHRHTKEFLRTL
jgi:hypothetical protein